MLDVCVSFRDLIFDHAYRWCRERDGSVTRRWVPIGVPRLAPNIEKAVFYLYRQEPDGTFTPGGTGFLVVRHSVRLPFTLHFYAVSNRHVVQGLGLTASACSCLRLNTKAGGVRFIEYEPTDWLCSDIEDLAIVDVTEQLGWSTETGLFSDDISAISEENFARQPYAGANTVALGEQSIMLGLFANHMRAGRNIPVARFGNIAATPSEDNLVRLSPFDRFARPAFLNDMRSRDGFSGSPVWAWQTKYDDMNNHFGPGFFPSVAARDKSSLLLAGIHRGQFPEKIIMSLEDGTKIKGEIPSSMTVVIPAWEIINLMNDPSMTKRAAERDDDPIRKQYSDEVCRMMRAQEARLRND